MLLFNFGSEAYKVTCGDRIAQLVLERISVLELEEMAFLDDTLRGDGAFGSTGS